MMKKTAVMVAVVAVAAQLTAYSAPQTLYFPNNSGWDWNFANPPVMAHDGDRFSYMAEGKDNASDIYFWVSEKTAADWSAYTQYGFDGLYAIEGDSGDTTDARQIATGTYPVWRYGKLAHCYKLEKGTKYVVTLDYSVSPAKMEIVDGNAAPENLYFVYSNSADGWHYADAPAFTRQGDRYTYAINTAEPVYFFVARDRRSSWDRMTDDNAGVAYMIAA